MVSGMSQEVISVTKLWETRLAKSLENQHCAPESGAL